MRNKLPLLLGATLLAFSAMACEGPVGPQGDRGPAGEVGAPGEPGQNALNTCSDCHHSDATIVAIEQQFDLSAHGFGNFELRGPDYAGGSCVACHTHNGFVAAATGEPANWDGGVASMNCRTCHQVHTTFEGDDYALTKTDPVTLVLTGNTVDFPSVGGNLCSECHQGREVSPVASADAAVTTMFTIGSFRYGPHYGPQANIYAAELPDALEFGDAVPIAPFLPHSELGCADCHMEREHMIPSPGSAGGHNFDPTNATCNTCHITPADFDYNGLQTEVQGLMADLKVCLEAEGVLRADGYAVEGDHPEPYVAAFLVYKSFYYDGSDGVHQPRYATTMLGDALTFMQANSTQPACQDTAL